MQSRQQSLEQLDDSTEGCSVASAPGSNMLVAVRLRPLNSKEIASGFKSCCKVINGKVVAITKAGAAGTYLRSQQGSINEYAFDVAFDEDTPQTEVYDQTARPFIPSVVEGYNVTVFAYGATGAGKTHTMMGSERVDEGHGGGRPCGIIPQSLIDIFEFVEQKRQACDERLEKYSVLVSYLEVYNEQVYDLLDPTGRPLALREDSQQGIVKVSGLHEASVDTPEEVLELLRFGNRQRKTEPTAANQVSSRSHAVLQVIVRYTTLDECGNDLVRESKLSLIDLAGSERASATNNKGARLQEGANINKSLLALANCINALSDQSQRGKRNVKYRDSKLTHLLKSSLEGNCKLIMIANVNPSSHCYEDSHNTLKYANRAKNIKVDPTIRVETKEVAWPERERRLKMANDALKEEINFLKQCLNMQGIPPVLDDEREVARAKHKRSADTMEERAEVEMKTPDDEDKNSDTDFSPTKKRRMSWSDRKEEASPPPVLSIVPSFAASSQPLSVIEEVSTGRTSDSSFFSVADDGAALAASTTEQESELLAENERLMAFIGKLREQHKVALAELQEQLHEAQEEGEYMRKRIAELEHENKKLRKELSAAQAAVVQSTPSRSAAASSRVASATRIPRSASKQTISKSLVFAETSLDESQEAEPRETRQSMIPRRRISVMEPIENRLPVVDETQPLQETAKKPTRRTAAGSTVKKVPQTELRRSKRLVAATSDSENEPPSTVKKRVPGSTTASILRSNSIAARTRSRQSMSVQLRF